jgi:WD40 repeat protein
MAPEQAAGGSKDIGPAADVYALGAILYELLTGRPPYRAATPLETLLLVQSDEPVPPSCLSPHLPRDLATICLKCLEKEPRKRYASAEALAGDLAHFLAGEPIQARPVGALGRSWRWCRRKPALATLIGAVGLMAAVITTISLVSALWLGAEAERARSAERGAMEKLLETTLAQAQALRQGGQMGQRFESLKKLRQAVQIARSLDVLDRHTLELRNEVIACLALADLGVTEQWKIPIPWDDAHECPVAFDPRLERYACTDQRGNIVIRQVAGHRDVARLRGRLPGAAARALEAALRFSPDGRYLAVGYWLDGRADRFVLWRLPRGGPPQEVFHIAGAAFFTFSGDGRLLAVALPDSSLSFYDLVRNKTQNLGPGFVATQMAFSPDSRQLAFVNHTQGNHVQILEVETGKVIKCLSHPAEVHALAWSADGRLLTAGCDDRNAYVWDTTEWRQQAVLEGHQKRRMTALAFSPVRTLLASSNPDGTTRLWDPVSGRQLVNAPGKLLQFSSDGRRLAFQRDQYLGIWKVADGRECRLLHHGRVGNRTPWTDHTGAECLDFHKGGRLLLSAGGDGVRLWDLGSCREIAYLNIGHHEAAVFHPDGTRFYTHGRTGLRCWPIRAELRRGPAGPVTPGYLIGPPQAREVRAGKGAFRACCSADGRWLAVSDFDHRRAFVLHAKRPGEKMLLDDTPGLHSLALSPDGRWVAAGPSGADSTLKVWDLRTGRLVWRSPTLHRFLLFSPDGRWLVGGGAKDCRLWRTGSWEKGPVFPRGGRYIMHGPLAFSRDGRLLAAPRSLQHVQLLDFAGHREVATLAAPDLPSVQWLCFSPDGSQLAASTESHTIQLWDLGAIGRTLQEMGLGSTLLPASSKKKSDPLNVWGLTPFTTAPRVRVWQDLYEGETLQVVSADCHHLDQEMSFFGREKWSSGRQRMCLPKKGGHVELLVTVPETTRYALTVSLTRAWDYGMVQLAIDGKKVGKVFDGFRPGIVPPTRVDYGTVQLREGSHRFRFTAVDKNPKSGNFYLGIDCLTLKPVK